MRRFDKKYNMLKANILAEQRYIQSKLIIEESELLTEGPKETLVNKTGYSEDSAEYLTNIARKLAVWLGNAIIADLISHHPEYATMDRKVLMDKITPSFLRQNYGEIIRGIMDWINHPLTQQQDLRNLTLMAAEEKAKNFHDELEALGGDVDFKEENEVIKKYPTSEGEFYWVKIDSNRCDLESKRMGHCGTSAYGNVLYSLRSITPYGKDHTISDSHVTIAFRPNDKLIVQAKGKKNQKPSDKYFPYIFDLIKEMAKNGNFLGFGVEYASSEDYGYSDMTKEQVDELYHINPKIFATYSGAKFLRSLGYDVETPRLVFNLHIDVDELDRFISFGRDLSITYVVGMLSGDIEYDNYHSTSWKYSTYDAENTNTIREFIKKTVHVLEDSEVTVDNIDDMDFEDLLKFANREEYYDDLMFMINDSYNACTSDANYYNVIASVKSTLEEYGTVRSLNDEGADMEIVLNSYLDNLNPSAVDELLANYDLPEAFAQLVADGEIEKPRLYIRDDSYCNDDNFNEILKERLGELN